MTKQTELKVWLRLLGGAVAMVVITGIPYLTDYTPMHSGSTGSSVPVSVRPARTQEESSVPIMRQQEALEQVSQQRLEIISQQYALDAAQRQQLKSLQDSAMPQMREIVLNPSLSREQKRAQVLALRAQMHSQVQQVIAPQKQPADDSKPTSPASP